MSLDDSDTGSTLLVSRPPAVAAVESCKEQIFDLIFDGCEIGYERPLYGTEMPLLSAGRNK